MKTSQTIITASAIFLLMLSGCSNKSTQPTANQRQTSTTKTADKAWHKGVPAKFKGYYGRQQKDTFEPFYLLDNKLNSGSNDDNLSYQQVDENTIIVKGTNQQNNDGKKYYTKVVFKHRQGKILLGTYNGDNIDHHNYHEVKNKAGRLTWYQRYSKEDFDKKLDQKATSNNNQNSTKTTDNTNNSSSFSLNDLQGKVFTSSAYPTEYLSFMEGASESDSFYSQSVTLFNVRMTGWAYPTLYLSKPEFQFHGNQVTIIGHGEDTNHSFKDHKLTLTKISSNQLKDSDGTIYTKYNGTSRQLTDEINQKEGYPVDPLTGESEDTDNDDE